jgi:hypothetical protein
MLSTLKILRLTEFDGFFGTACIPGFLPGLVSCCDTLEVLQCPWDIFSALPATCPGFPRLIELALEGRPDDDVACASKVWDIMASGRLPALATFRADCYRESWGPAKWGEGGCRLARAFEAVAGTLKRLHLTGRLPKDQPVVASYDLGVAIGKLHRLEILLFNQFGDGREYHAVGRGMAASGGCPELLKLDVHGLGKNVDWLTFEPSLIVSSVRNLTIAAVTDEEEALLVCCGLVETGYRFRFEDHLEGPLGTRFSEELRACMRAILQCRGGTNVKWRAIMKL